MSNLGNKILIIGVNASGKSTFAKKLSDKIKIPVTFMDSIMWNPGWNYVGDEETVRRIKDISSKSEWIIEGYITKESRTYLFDEADKIIYLDYSPIVSSLKDLKRYWKHRKIARPELEGSPEKFSFKFLKLVWTKGEAISINKFLLKVKDQNKIVTLHSPRQAKKFLKDI